jgi:hypothetical protein
MSIFSIGAGFADGSNTPSLQRRTERVPLARPRDVERAGNAARPRRSRRRTLAGDREWRMALARHTPPAQPLRA